MKWASKIFTLTALAIACSGASAQQTASVAVTGSIVPAACTVSMSNGGAFKYVNFPADWLNFTGTTPLDMSSATFNLSCMDPSQLSWAIVDNRRGTSAPAYDTPQYLGLNKDHDGHKIGMYTVRMSNPLLDGEAAYLMKSIDGGKNWTPAARSGYDMQAAPSQEIYSYSKSGADTLDKGSVFSMTLAVYPTITQKRYLDTSDEIDLDGSATINLRYL